MENKMENNFETEEDFWKAFHDIEKKEKAVKFRLFIKDHEEYYRQLHSVWKEGEEKGVFKKGFADEQLKTVKEAVNDALIRSGKMNPAELKTEFSRRAVAMKNLIGNVLSRKKKKGD